MRGQGQSVMGKSRKSEMPKLAQGACRDDHPGSEGKADAPRPVETAAGTSRTAEFRMILDESVPMVLDRPSAPFEQRDAARMASTITANEDHPLAGLSPQRRTQDRIDA